MKKEWQAINAARLLSFDTAKSSEQNGSEHASGNKMRVSGRTTQSMFAAANSFYLKQTNARFCPYVDWMFGVLQTIYTNCLSVDHIFALIDHGGM